LGHVRYNYKEKLTHFFSWITL